MPNVRGYTNKPDPPLEQLWRRNKIWEKTKMEWTKCKNNNGANTKMKRVQKISKYKNEAN